MSEAKTYQILKTRSTGTDVTAEIEWDESIQHLSLNGEWAQESITWDAVESPDIAIKILEGWQATINMAIESIKHTQELGVAE